MNHNKILDSLSKEELIELIGAYSKNWLAMDGVWFQSIEKKLGMDEAMFHDGEAWRIFTEVEARRIKQFLKLPEYAGVEGLRQALSLRFYANINRDEIIIKDNTLLYRVLECSVQTARQRKQMGFHPCKRVGIIEYSGFAKIIDRRITCECLSCYPDSYDQTCCCSWKFTLHP
ncbi:MAG: DUF6125 family protein [Christensenella sp.]|nr:DUF6125 family protein [Christensenella sp.]